MIPTFGGQATRSETYTKLMHHLIEAQELAAVLSHLHNTEDSTKDKLLAKAWLLISEHFRMMQKKITTLAMGTLQ